VIVLGIDTVTSATAVALRVADGQTREARDDPAPGAHPGHATRLLGMAAELLDAAGLTARELDRIAVGVGPGAFTGLRVGVATARALAQSLASELVGVSSLAALARTGPSGRPLLAVIDARRGEVFAAPFSSPEGPELAAAAVLAPERIGALAGPDAVAVGDGAKRYRAELEAAGLDVPPDDAPEHLLRATAICELALERDPSGDERSVVPDYLRRPDAELTLHAGGAR
jgi:tRNA threonylcarbamoyladenosine biosynthesis protein TsaB